MIAKSEQCALGEAKGYTEGKQVGFEEGRRKGREEARQELFTQGDEAFVRKLQEEKGAAYTRGYTRYQNSRSSKKGPKRAANRKRDAGQMTLALE